MFHLTPAGSNLLQGDYDGWIKSGKREYDRNDLVSMITGRGMSQQWQLMMNLLFLICPNL